MACFRVHVLDQSKYHNAIGFSCQYKNTNIYTLFYVAEKALMLCFPTGFNDKSLIKEIKLL